MSKGGVFLAALQEKNQRHQRGSEETAHSEASDTLHELPYLRVTTTSSSAEPNPLAQTASNRTSRSLSALDDAEDNGIILHTSSLNGVLLRNRKSAVYADGMRERSPSQTSVDSMYGRTGKVMPRFEVTNPLLEPRRQPERRATASMSEKELHTERIKMDALLHSAPRLDPAIFIEQRRGTRRTSNVEVL